MVYVTARQLQDEFKLPLRLAQEIASEQTRLALLWRWPPWAWLAGCSILLATGTGLGWLPPFRQLWHAQPFALLIMLIMLGGWLGLGRWLAGPAIRAEASEKARRLGLRALP